MVAQANFSHKSLQGLNSSQLQDKLFLEKGINFNDLPVWQKRGAAIIRKQKPKTVTYNGEEKTVLRNVWEVDFETPVFSQDKNYIEQYVYPKKEESKFEQLQYDAAHVEDFIISFAQENGLDDFRQKWGEKPYSDENHTLLHMVEELLGHLKEKQI